MSMAFIRKRVPLTLALLLSVVTTHAAAADTDGLPTLPVTPSSLSFGTINVGASSAVAMLSVQGNAGNRGIPDPLANVSVTLPAGWQRSGGTCPASGVAPNPCTIGVVFAPSAVGAQAGNAQVTASVFGGAPITTAVPLSGTAVASTAVAAPSLDALGLGVLGSVLLLAGLLTLRQRG
jgi:hypothetical protein